MEKMTIDHTIQLIFDDPSASDWIKQSLQQALDRDPVDAVNDARILHMVLDHKARNVIQVHEFRRELELERAG